MKPVADKRAIVPRGRLESDLALHALGFVARVDGQVDDAARSRFRRFVRARRGAASVAEMARALDEALAPEMFGRLTTNRCRGAMFDYAKAAHALESFSECDAPR